MSYLVLARKWRPLCFETLVGQDHVVRALAHALDNQRLHHAYLFTGTRGVGKTTLARIFAKALNCEKGISSRPCGVCRSCQEIDTGRFIDYIEMDAASNRGVDEMTRLLEQAVYAPTVAKFKVYMIDEVHMLTTHAFNAMLKTLEEPPGHVKFLLATTDPQKIPATVLSRCLQFNLRQMSVPAIISHLDDVLQQEHVPHETSALGLIANAACGSMRDALSLTDQAIAYSAANITEEAVRSMLGTVDQRYLIRLLQAVKANDTSAVIAIAEEIQSRSLSYSAALADLASLLAQIALFQSLGSNSENKSFHTIDSEIAQLALEFPADFIQLLYSIALHSRAELVLMPDEYAGFVMACLRLLAFAPEKIRHTSLPGSILKKVVQEKQVDLSSDLGIASLPSRTDSNVLEDSTGSKQLVASNNLNQDLTESSSVLVNSLTPLSSPTEPITSETKLTLVTCLSSLNAENWPQVVAQLGIKGIAAQLAQQSELVIVEGNILHLRVAARPLAEAPIIDKLTSALSQFFSQPVMLKVEIGATNKTAHIADRTQRAQQHQLREQSLQADPFVQKIIQVFDAQVLPESISSN